MINSQAIRRVLLTTILASSLAGCALGGLTIPISDPSPSSVPYSQKSGIGATSLSFADVRSTLDQQNFSTWIVPMNFTNNGKPLDPIAFVSEHTSRELVARGIALEKAPVTNNIKVSISKIGIQNHRANGFSPMVTLTSLVADVDTPSGRKRMSVLIKRGKVPVWSFDELNSPCYDEPMNLLTKELAAKINRDVFGLRIDDAEVDRLLAKIKAEAATNPMAYFDVYQLGFGNNPRAIDGLVQLTASEHEYVRLAAISSLGIIKARSQQARLESLYRGIGADLWQDRAIALKAIGDLDSNESRAFLQAELERLKEQDSRGATWMKNVIALYL
jgi:hypothetical protein